MTVQFRTPEAKMIDLPTPYLLFLGDTTDRSYAKTALGLKDWAPDLCLAEIALPECTVTTGLPQMTPAEAVAAGARSLVIGVAAEGGQIRDNWLPLLIEALEAGLDIVSGMHSRVEDIPALFAAVRRTARRIIDVRRPPANLPVGDGHKRSGKRLLTVGNDCALGKKYTALAIARSFRALGVVTDFRATGQTGIMIAGAGIPIDSVVADFVAGAAETLSPDAAPDHWDVIEGQGSLYHPAYAGVSLGLLHGSQPDVIIVCHEAGRAEILGCPGYKIPTLTETIALNLAHARRTNPAARCAGISLNTSTLSPDDAAAALAEATRETGLPAADPIRGGPTFDQLVAACLA